MSGFTILCFIIGALIIISSAINLLFPPGRRWWSNGIKLSFAWRSELARQEANRFVAKASIYFGIGFFVIGIMSLIFHFPETKTDTRVLFLLVFFYSIVMRWLTKTHIDKLFDENGERRA
jgi:hypothetical protein